MPLTAVTAQYSIIVVAFAILACLGYVKLHWHRKLSGIRDWAESQHYDYVVAPSQQAAFSISGITTGQRRWHLRQYRTGSGDLITHQTYFQVGTKEWPALVADVYSSAAWEALTATTRSRMRNKVLELSGGFTTKYVGQTFPPVDIPLRLYTAHPSDESFVIAVYDNQNERLRELFTIQVRDAINAFFGCLPTATPLTFQIRLEGDTVFLAADTFLPLELMKRFLRIGLAVESARSAGQALSS